MAKAKALYRSEVERRPQETEVKSALIEKIAKRAGITDQAVKQKLTYTIQAYRARALADQQERPARMVAAIEPVLQSARDAAAQLNALPAGVLTGQQQGSIQTFLKGAIRALTERAGYWRKHIAAHRPLGEEAASLALRLSLIDICTTHFPDVPEWKIRQRVAWICHEIGAPCPNEKNDRKRFMGEHKPKHPEGPPAPQPRGPDVAGVVEPSEVENRLKDHPI
jgi:hypothetical protein